MSCLLVAFRKEALCECNTPGCLAMGWKGTLSYAKRTVLPKGILPHTLELSCLLHKRRQSTNILLLKKNVKPSVGFSNSKAMAALGNPHPPPPHNLSTMQKNFKLKNSVMASSNFERTEWAKTVGPISGDCHAMIARRTTTIEAWSPSSSDFYSISIQVSGSLGGLRGSRETALNADFFFRYERPMKMRKRSKSAWRSGCVK